MIINHNKNTPDKAYTLHLHKYILLSVPIVLKLYEVIQHKYLQAFFSRFSCVSHCILRHILFIFLNVLFVLHFMLISG